MKIEKNNHKISIAMATYNGEQYILEQLESIANQTLLPFEVVITDDQSTDKTIEIIQDFAKTAKFIVKAYKNQARLGYCGNFNAALLKTEGDYVFLCDQDDVWFPDKLEVMVEKAKQYPEIFVLMNDAELTLGDLTPVGLTKVGQIKSLGLSMDSFVMGCCCLIKRDFLDICLPIPPESKAHDNWIVSLADALKGKMIIPQVLQYYRRHEDNTSGFIANRTTKVNRFHRYYSAIKGLFSDDRQKSCQDINLYGVYCKHLKKIKESCKNKIILKNIDNAIKHYGYLNLRSEERKKIRSKSHLRRFIPIMRGYLSGIYNYGNPLLSMIRDLICKKE